jgi:NADH-quinone oxidoreductase subunit C
MIEKVIQLLKDNFNDVIEDVILYLDEITFVINKKEIVRVCDFLKNNEELKFISLLDVCGVDRYTKKERFEVAYNLWSDLLKTRIRLRVKLDEKDLTVDSVTSIWKSANWYERETYDMFGIVFNNHPDLRRIYMTEDYEYFPLRKDFSLLGIPDSIPLPRKIYG